MEDFTKTLAGEWEEAERLAACSGDRTLTLSLVEQPKPTELATLKAENVKLREIVSRADGAIKALQRNEQLWRAEWEQISETAKVLQEKLAAATERERERCAKVCEDIAQKYAAIVVNEKNKSPILEQATWAQSAAGQCMQEIRNQP